MATRARVESGGRRDYLWIVLFAIIFVNGFESGGYQASLTSIGATYDLSVTSMGLFAALELFADMLAPLLLGSWADHVGKKTSIMVALIAQVISSVLILFTKSQPLFLVGIFLLGLTTSALQFIAIAALADAYPASNGRKIGYMTSMYALGAVVSPLVVSFYLGLGLTWRTLFALLAVVSVVAFIFIRSTTVEAREASPRAARSQNKGAFVLLGILLLCVVMCVYVGFENGFSFFVDTLFADVFKSDLGKRALSLYWFTMIPARVLVGRFSEHSRRILVGSIIAIPLVTALIAISPSPILVTLLIVPLGLASGAIYPCVLTLMLPFAGSKTATATGLITAATGIGGFALTALTGLMADLWGMRVSMAVLAGFFVFALAAALKALSMSKEGGVRAA